MFSKILILLFITNFGLIYGMGGHGNHRIAMGVLDSNCDDGRYSLQTDWSGSRREYTCSQNNFVKTIPAVPAFPAIEQCEQGPFYPQHICMNQKIFYNHILPTHGDHRPLWPKFGEYHYVPPQRWSHSVEHGAIVMLYHPCADKDQVNILRNLVVNCIRKHVITAYNLLPMDRPFALVGWGCRLMFTTVNKNTVISFIKRRGMGGPEAHVHTDGQYNFGIKTPARIPLGSDIMDSRLCPFN